MNIYRERGKRTFDLLFAVLALAVIAPLLGLVAILVRITVGSPILFCQHRPGLRGRPFRIFKFRTMTNQRDDNGNLLPDAQRLTRFGRLLRRTSLDELPELLNVVRGDMSLVGPRPLLMEYLDSYTPEQAGRHLVRPGITGWAQINGRNNTVFSERLQLDIWYVNHVSFALDVIILCRTLLQVACASGVRLDQSLDEVDDIGLHPQTRRADHSVRTVPGGRVIDAR